MTRSPASSHLLAERREKLERLREAGVEPFPHDFEGRAEIAEVHDRARGARRGEETDALPRRRADRGPAPATWGRRRSSTSSTAAGGSSSTARREDSARRRRASARPRPRRHRWRRGDRSRPSAASSRRGDWTLLAKSLRRRPTSTTASRTSSRATAPRARPDRNAEARELFEKRGAGDDRGRKWLDAEGFLEVETPVCGRSTAVRWHGRSPRTTTPSIATSTCGSPPSST